MAGGPSTPELTAAVSDAGGFGFLAAGYLEAQALQAQIASVRSLTDRPFGVNLFVPGPPSADMNFRSYAQELARWAEQRNLPIGEPRYSDDAFGEKLKLLLDEPVSVVSFTFGCPPADLVDKLHAVGSEAWVTVTTPTEASQAALAGADVLVAQGEEAGGHRASFEDRPDPALYATLPLVQLIRAQWAGPIVAAGGIATGAAVAAVLCAGATAAQMGSAFLLSPEAGTSPAQREALSAGRPTGLTRAFSGRLARGICNAFMNAHDPAPIAYPEIHYITAPMRRAARERGDAESINLWAGQSHALAREAPAAEIVGHLRAEARVALQTAAERLPAGPRVATDTLV
jgi:nitronate monooxygenase